MCYRLEKGSGGDGSAADVLCKNQTSGNACMCVLTVYFKTLNLKTCNLTCNQFMVNMTIKSAFLNK